MTCQRFRELDVEAFLVDSESDAFDSFRMHWFDCPECSEAVAHWTRLESGLRDVMDQEDGPAAHPEPERLELFARAKDQMGDEAMAIESHLSGCRMCQTELSALARFEDGFLAAIGGSARAAANPVSSSLETAQESASFSGKTSGKTASDRATDAGGGFGRLLETLGEWTSGWRIAAPAFAAAIAILAGLWMSGVFESSSTQPGSPEPAPQVVMEPPAEVERPLPPAPEPPSRLRPEQFAIGTEAQSDDDPSRVAAPTPAPEPVRPEALKPETAEEQPLLVAEASARDERPVPNERADAPATETPQAPAPAERLAPAPREEILLAALTELPLPDYAAPPQPGSVGWMRQFGAVRGETTAAQVETRAPQSHAGLALSSSPRLWWNLSKATDLAVEITVVDDRELDPITRIELPGPISAGLHSVDLSQHGVSLEANVEYRWFVSLIVDPNRPSRNPVAAGALRVLGPDDPRRSEAQEASPSERGHALARLGVWYDAYDFFASISQSHPELGALARHREHLTKTAGAGG